MPATIDKTEIINWALTKIGVGAVYSTEDESELALTIENVWQPTVDYAFSMEDWFWTKRTRKLERHAATPENGWAYGYDLPAERIGPAIAFLDQVGISRRVLRNYNLEGKSVFCDVPDCWAQIKVVVAIDDWDVSFRAAFVVLLASEFAVSVMQDASQAQTLRAEAIGTPAMQGSGGMFGKLIAQNKAAQPMGAEPLMATDPLDDARYGANGRDASWCGRQ
jgi:hypothetical protein